MNDSRARHLADVSKLPAAVSHPAKWNDSVLERMPAIVHRWLPNLALDPPPRVLDPYGGVGTIHRLNDWHEWDTVSVEREASYVVLGRVNNGRNADRCFVGDAGLLPCTWSGCFDAIITSPTWGNRLADRYLGGADIASGRRPPAESRLTYATSLGYIPDEGSTCVLPWGDEYRQVHEAHLASWVPLLRPDAVVIIDIADHTRDHKRRHVVDWWGSMLRKHVGRVEEKIAVSAPRYGHGQNRGERWPEMLLVAVKRTKP